MNKVEKTNIKKGNLKDKYELDAQNLLIENHIINENKLFFIKNNKKSLIVNLFSGIIFIISYFLYFFSLEGCYEGENVCSTKKIWITHKILEEVISCILIEIMLELIIFKIISSLHFIHIIIYFFSCLYYSHGKIFDNHGYYNFIYFFILLLLLTIILLPFFLMFYCINNYNKKIYIIYFAVFIGFYFIAFISLLSSNCNGWEKGLNNTSIDNNKEKHGCKIVIPNNCGYKIFKIVLDYTRIMKKNCKTFKIKNPKQFIFSHAHSPFINDTVKRIGIPLTNYDSECLLDLDGNICSWNCLYKNLVDLNNKEILDKYFKEKIPEIEIDFTNNEQGEMIINLHFNKSLSEERKLLEKKANPYADNILLIYIDSVSRANSIRQLKKTLKFIAKFMSYKGGYNEKYPSENFHSFQFFKYHSFQDFTEGNYPYIFYGKKKKSKNMTLIAKYLKEIGYVTCYVHDSCRIDNTRMYHNLTREEIYDHQFLQCDPYGEHFSLSTIRCLHGKQNLEHFIEYISQFWRKYKSNRKFATILTNHGHEGTLNLPSHIDDILYNFLNNLFEDNLLKKTSIILLSDHGSGMPSILYLYDFYKKEIHLPMLYLIINDRKNKSYEEQYKYMNDNQQIFITSLDIYNTIGNLAFGDNYI